MMNELPNLEGSRSMIKFSITPGPYYTVNVSETIWPVNCRINSLMGRTLKNNLSGVAIPFKTTDNRRNTKSMCTTSWFE